LAATTRPVLAATLVLARCQLDASRAVVRSLTAPVCNRSGRPRVATSPTTLSTSLHSGEQCICEREGKRMNRLTTMVVVKFDVDETADRAVVPHGQRAAKDD
jgi:hypothetical protein